MRQKIGMKERERRIAPAWAEIDDRNARVRRRDERPMANRARLLAQRTARS
jgi:hypothetical protein